MGYQSLSAQYYFTGEVKDLHGDRLQNVSVLVQSTGLAYRTGLNGNFEIISRKTEDTLTFLFDGYERYTTVIHSTDILQVTLKQQSFPALSKGSRILSRVNGTGISFAGYGNGLSYSNVRRFLDMGYAVPAEAVKIEEMLNYFNFYYEEPEKEDLFHCSSQLLSCPWNESHKLLCLNICSRKTDMQKAPPANLVFLIDASGSMDMPNKISLIKSGIRLLVKNLRDIDTVSIVIFGGRTEVVLYAASGSKKETIIGAIEGLHPDGPSPGDTGLRLAYEVARKQFIPGGNNRIILLTDGDITEGADAGRELSTFVAQESEAGIRLSCLGVGTDSTRDSELPALALTGHGNFATITDAQTAEQLLVNELAHTLCTVADSVAVTIGFDTALVKEYRLIGFDNKKNPAGDTTFTLEGSKIGSGHSLMALFELITKKDTLGIEDIARVKIDYCLPGKGMGQTMDYNCPNKPIPFDKAGGNGKRAVCVALFGMKLKESGYAGGASWADIEKMARKNFSGNNYIDRDYITVVLKARKIYERKRAANDHN